MTVEKQELAVMLDSQGVSYLRLGTASNGDTLLVLNSGRSVDVVHMDAKTVKSRYLQVVHNANILDAVKTLLHPLSNSVTISKSAAAELNKILNDKELIARMTPETAVATKPKVAARGPKPVKVGTGRAPKPVKTKEARASKSDGSRLSADTMFSVNENKIPAKLKEQLANTEKQSHSLVVLRYLLGAKKAQNGEAIIAGVKKTGKYKTEGKPDSLILGDLRILAKNGLVSITQ